MKTDDFKDGVKIAFCGRKRTGKDFYADFLRTEFDYKVFSFSDVIKEKARLIFPFMKSDYTQEEKESLIVHRNSYSGKEYTPREIWQSMNFAAEIYDQFCIHPVKYDIENYINSFYEDYAFNDATCDFPKVLVKDLRFKRERDFLVENGFEIIGLFPFDEELTHGKHSNHVSETEVDEIMNNVEHKVTETHFLRRNKQLADILDKIYNNRIQRSKNRIQ